MFAASSVVPVVLTSAPPAKQCSCSAQHTSCGSFDLWTSCKECHNSGMTYVLPSTRAKRVKRIDQQGSEEVQAQDIVAFQAAADAAAQASAASVHFAYSRTRVKLSSLARRQPIWRMSQAHQMNRQPLHLWQLRLEK